MNDALPVDKISAYKVYEAGLEYHDRKKWAKAKDFFSKAIDVALSESSINKKV